MHKQPSPTRPRSRSNSPSTKKPIKRKIATTAKKAHKPSKIVVSEPKKAFSIATTRMSGDSSKSSSQSVQDEDDSYAPLFPKNPKPLFLVCDIQEPFRSTMHYFPRLIESSKLLLNFAREMEYDVRVSEQLPFAGTVPELRTVLETIQTANPSKIKEYKKKKFSMIPDIVDVNWDDYNAVVLFGIESHVCVLQTYKDLVQILPPNVPLYLVKDATFSQRMYDRSSALTQMVDAIQITSEALLYGFMASAEHPKFKTMLPYVKEHAKFIKDNNMDVDSPV